VATIGEEAGAVITITTVAEESLEIQVRWSTTVVERLVILPWIAGVSQIPTVAMELVQYQPKLRVNSTLKTHDIMLCSVTQISAREMPTTVNNMIADDVLFFLDSAASYSTTNSAHGLPVVDIKMATDDDAAIRANGGFSTSQASSKLPVAECSKSGKEQFNIVLTTVAYVPTSPCNLISTGDKAKLRSTTVIKADGAYMAKGGVKIALDIVVDTNHGWCCAIRLKRGVGQWVGQNTEIEVTMIKSDVLPGRTLKFGVTMNIM
jgi:hypothetical protein